MRQNYSEDSMARISKANLRTFQAKFLCCFSRQRGYKSIFRKRKHFFSLGHETFSKTDEHILVESYFQWKMNNFAFFLLWIAVIKICDGQRKVTCIHSMKTGFQNSWLKTILRNFENWLEFTVRIIFCFS